MMVFGIIVFPKKCPLFFPFEFSEEIFQYLQEQAIM
ncbi:hypothetical protein NC651_037903 [Populus alba x Populus x berolinensis]|nr:hypothetical protein NC651_037903 [Populus alba x Populus x berolinensis]